MKIRIKEYLEAAYHLLFFKTYTTHPRWYEIMLGIQTWCYFSGAIYVLILMLKRLNN